MNRAALTFVGLVMHDGKGFYSLCPELDVASQGRTVAEAKTMLRDAVTGYLEACFESNLPCLRPTPDADDPRVMAPTTVAASFRLKVNLTVKVHAA